MAESDINDGESKVTSTKPDLPCLRFSLAPYKGVFITCSEETAEWYYSISNIGSELTPTKKDLNAVTFATGGAGHFFQEDVFFRLDRKKIPWTVTTKTESEHGTSTTTEHYEGIFEIAPPYSQAEMGKFRGYTFTECYIGGPFSDVLSGSAGAGNEYLKMQYLNLDGVTFRKCKIQGEDVFAHTDLNGCTFEDCELIGIDFSQCGNPYIYSTERQATKDAYDNPDHGDYNEGYYGDDDPGYEEPTPDTRKNTYNRGHKHNPRPYPDWSDTLYEQIDANDHEYSPEVSYISFKGSTLENCKFADQDMIGLNLTNTTFNGGSFNNVRIQESTYNNTAINGTTLNKVRFVNVVDTSRGRLILSNVGLNDVVISGVTMSGISFKSNTYQKVYINQSVLSDCDFSNLNLRNLGVQDCSLTNCNFSGANLVDCSFIGSVFNNCNLSNFTSEIYKFPYFKNCTLKNTPFSTSGSANFTDFFNCVLENMSISNISFIFANFDCSTIKDTTFSNCKFNGVMFRKAEIRNLTVNNSVLRGAKFTDANVYNSNFNNCDVRGAEFVGGNNSSTNFNNCQTDGLTR